MNSGVLVDMVDSAKSNASATDMKVGSSGLRNILVTYKRRKKNKVSENGTTWVDSVTQFDVKSEVHLSYEEKLKRSHGSIIASCSCSVKQQRDIVLEQMRQSLESESVLTKCIQKAIAFHSGSCSKTIAKESVYLCETGSKWTFQTGSAHDDLQKAAKSLVGMTSSGSIDESNHDTVTELCLGTFSNIIMSEQFEQLCNLLLENFERIKAPKLMDLCCLSSRIKEKVYETSPVLFNSDAQQIWIKLQKIGTDMIALAKFLSDKTTSSFYEQFITQASDMHTKLEKTEACCLDEVHTCNHCGDKANVRNCLICDSCEKIYHISCIDPPIQEIPDTSWYCVNCTTNGIESPHVNCVACERVNTSRSTFEDKCKEEFLQEESPEELEKSSNTLIGSNCKVCRNEVTNDDDHRICGHPICPRKFHHVKCLTDKQLSYYYGSRWYCPSCVCQACFNHQDDDKIVLCDGCDCAYHIYCLDPSRISIPEEEWFCKECDSGIQLIRKARQTYENIVQNKSKKKEH